MKRFKYLFVLLFALVVTSQIHAEDSAAWLRTRMSNALNPKISLIGDFVYQTGPKQQNDFSMREVELAIQSEIDPHTRADFYFALPNGESFELEEGYLTLLSLPGGFQLRGGKFLPNFGRLNMIHTHELPFVDTPLAIEHFLGEEGLKDTGVEISRIFTPLGLFTETSYAFLNGIGAEEEPRELTTDFLDVNGSTVSVTVKEETEENKNRKLRDFAHVAKIRFFKDISENSNIDLGFSGALYQPKDSDQTKLGSIDLTFRLKPAGQNSPQSLIWRTEALYSKKNLIETSDLLGNLSENKAEVERYAGYSYVEYQFAQRWKMGLRGDYLEDPNDRDELLVTRAVSPFLTFASTEFSRYRIQYQYKHLPRGNAESREHIGYLQWTIVMGPHGAHPF
ncbi:MAG: hypothetical protein ACKVQC_03270 [Elusimicrobiota bacterium]